MSSKASQYQAISKFLYKIIAIMNLNLIVKKLWDAPKVDRYSRWGCADRKIPFFLYSFRKIKESVDLFKIFD